MILVLFWISIPLAIFLWIAMTHVLSGITELAGGVRDNKKAVVRHGIKRVAIWGLFVAAVVYAFLLLFEYAIGVALNNLIQGKL